MSDQRAEIEKFLNEMGLDAKGWTVVKPVYGEIVNEVWLQKTAPLAKGVKNVRLHLPRTDLEFLPPTEIKKRILNAIGK